MIFLSLFKFEIFKNVKDNLIIYMKIKMIKLQINDQILTVQNVCYSDDLAHNLIFYELLKWQSFKIENVEEDKLNIFKITNFQEQIFKTFLSEINIYSFLNLISSIFLILLTASAKNKLTSTNQKSTTKTLKSWKYDTNI